MQLNEEVAINLSLSVGMSLMMQVATELKTAAKDFNVAVLVSIRSCRILFEKELPQSAIVMRERFASECVTWDVNVSGDQSCHARREQSAEGRTRAVMESRSTHTNPLAASRAARNFFRVTHGHTSQILSTGQFSIQLTSKETGEDVEKPHVYHIQC